MSKSPTVTRNPNSSKFSNLLHISAIQFPPFHYDIPGIEHRINKRFLPNPNVVSNPAELG